MDLDILVNLNNIENGKVDYSKYLDVSESNFELPIRANNYDTIDSDDLKALYSCVMENIKKIKE